MVDEPKAGHCGFFPHPQHPDICEAIGCGLPLADHAAGQRTKSPKKKAQPPTKAELLADLIASEWLNHCERGNQYEIDHMLRMAKESDREFVRSLSSVAYRLECFAERIRTLANDYVDARLTDEITEDDRK